nr:MAG TPA: hypothetical protein [Caudoviricetes sp.]
MAPPPCRHPRHLRHALSPLWKGRRRHSRPSDPTLDGWRQQP